MRRAVTLHTLRFVAPAICLAAVAAVPMLPGAFAQDVRGMEVCTAEKQMERRTSCLQANTDYLQALIERQSREARQKFDAAAKELSAARTEISSLKAALAAMQARIDKLEKQEQPAPKK